MLASVLFPFYIVYVYLVSFALLFVQSAKIYTDTLVVQVYMLSKYESQRHETE